MGIDIKKYYIIIENMMNILRNIIILIEIIISRNRGDFRLIN